MIENFIIIWTIVSVLILFVTIRLGVKHKKNIYRIVGWNLLSFLIVLIGGQLAAFKIYLYTAESEFEKAEIGTTMTIKGWLDFHIRDLPSGDSLIFILSPDSVDGNKIIRSDSTHFTISIPPKKPVGSSIGMVVHVYSDKIQTRKFRDFDITELMRDKKQVEIGFTGKKTDVNSVECINILSIDKRNSENFPLAVY